MNGRFQKIGNRSLVGLGVVLAIGLCIEAGAWAVFGLFGLVAALGLRECGLVFARGGHAVKPYLVYGLGGVLYVGLGLCLLWRPWPLVTASAGLCGVAVSLWPWWQYRGRTPEPPADGGVMPQGGAGWSVRAAVYVTVPLALLVWLSREALIWPLFLCVWANDVFAYIVGSSFKEERRHKLAPRISPAKSWEGAAGGFCAAVAAGWGWAALKGLPVVPMLLFAAVVAVAGVAGDLLESYYKRSAGLKDSGTLLGGHGGILDRFDSVLAAAPAAVLVRLIWHLI